MATQEILVKAGQFLLSLSLLVVLHEMGHFFPAKLFKTKVEKFYLFFDPWFSLFKFKKGDTEYGVGWLPLGGYVKISGMVDESMDREQMMKPPQPWEFRSKPAWQRLIIMIGGVTVNMIVGFLIYAMMLWYWGESYLPVQNVKYGVTVDSLAESIGMRDGDKILGVDHVKAERFNDIVKQLVLREAKSIQVERNGQELSLAIPPGFIRQMIKQRTGFATPRFPYYISDLPKESAARTAGLQKGDQIISLNGEQVPYLSDFQKRLKKYKEQEVTVGFVRGRDTLQRTIKVSDKGQLGVYADVDAFKYFTINTKQYTFLEAIPAGFQKCIKTLVGYAQQLRLIFVSKEIKASESVGGFLSIGDLFPGQWDWMAFWEMTALLSIILAFMNILPIPALDGGHVLFLLYEMVTGRKPNEKFLEYAQIVGMALLFGLLLYANGLDLWRNVFSKWFS